MRQVIHHNLKGDVTKTEPKGRGKPRSSWTLDEDGNYHAHPETVFTKPRYVTLLKNGEVQEEYKGRGRTRAGFVKQASGAWMGHYVKDKR